MQQNNIKNPIIVMVTVSSEDEAKSIGQSLIEKKLAACVNIIPGIRSLFVWQKKMCNEKETLLLIKSHRDLLHKIITLVKELHSYDVPEVIALPIVGGSEDYFKWMEESLNF